MKVLTERLRHIAVVRPVGRLVGAPDFALRESVAAAIAAGSRRVILDLGDIEQIDSGGIGDLVSAYATAAKRGGSLGLAQLSPRVAETLGASRLRSIFAIYSTVDEAIAAEPPSGDAARA